MEVKGDMSWKAISKAHKSPGMGMEGGSTVSRAVSEEGLGCQWSVFAYVQSLSFTKQNGFVVLHSQKAVFSQILIPPGCLEEVSLRDTSPMIFCD